MLLFKLLLFFYTLCDVSMLCTALCFVNAVPWSFCVFMCWSLRTSCQMSHSRPKGTSLIFILISSKVLTVLTDELC